jgi:serine/threonine protein phosphatase PrpC/predicted Ser/Thr protein kinase
MILEKGGNAKAMRAQLSVTIGQHSQRGRKAVNQDFHAAQVPSGGLLTTKGIALALADGISSSDVAHIASESAVTGFLADYYCTPEPWSVKQSAQRVLTAINSWLYAQTRRSQYRDDANRGYVCTMSVMVLKSTTAHLFHVGDARIYRRSGNVLEQLTNDHRVRVDAETCYLGRAMGVDAQVEIDYLAVPLEIGDVYLLVTDGVYEYVDDAAILDAIDTHAADLDAAAAAITDRAYGNGSRDNLTAQVLRVEALPPGDVTEVHQRYSHLPLPPSLRAGAHLDGYTIVRELHAGSRSHVYLAVDDETGAAVALKTLSTELQQDPEQLERFLTEEWIARRVDSPHVAKAVPTPRRRSCLYTVTEYIEGQTLAQWMTDNPRPDLERVRSIVEQVARGLCAFHRLEMLHQDLRPANVMIDTTGTIKLIDFGSARVAGIAEMGSARGGDEMLGTMPYAAPEYFIGEAASPRSDLFSLAVMTYQMLTGRLPYGVAVARTRSRADQHRLRYTSALNYNRNLPPWIDGVLKKALDPDPFRRHEALSELVYDLRHPKNAFAGSGRPALIERDPVRFWQGVSALLALVIALILAMR